MGILDLLDSFDAAAYRRRLRLLGRDEICKREIQKRRQLYGAEYKMAGMSFSLIGPGLGARQYSIAVQKLAVIQQIMKEEGWMFHTESTRDMLIPFGSTVVGMDAGGAVDVGIGHVVRAGTTMSVQQGTDQVVRDDTASETFIDAVSHPVDFASGIEHGIGMGADQAASVFHAGDIATNSAMATMEHAIPLDSSAATSKGMVLGHTEVLDGIQRAVTWTAGSAMKWGGDKIANGQLRKSQLPDSQRCNNQSLSTKIPKHLRSLLRDSSVTNPMSASNPQLWRTINSIPSKILWDIHAMGGYPLFFVALSGLGIAAFFHAESLCQILEANQFITTVSKSATSSFRATIDIISYAAVTTSAAVFFVFWAAWNLGLEILDGISYWMLQASVTGFGALINACQEITSGYGS